jgi:hypothetical protein
MRWYAFKTHDHTGWLLVAELFGLVVRDRQNTPANQAHLIYDVRGSVADLKPLSPFTLRKV